MRVMAVIASGPNEWLSRKRTRGMTTLPDLRRERYGSLSHRRLANVPLSVIDKAYAKIQNQDSALIFVCFAIGQYPPGHWNTPRNENGKELPKPGIGRNRTRQHGSRALQIPAPQMSRLAAASTIPVTNAAKQANTRRSCRILIMAAPRPRR